jgi:DNA polymerase
MAPVDALAVVAAEAAECTRCDLYKRATRTVFGEGDAAAALMLVGEQPGDREDLAGHPFVGPAGAVLDVALAQAGVPADGVWTTNAVKHFKWTPRGKRRIHDKPNAGEIQACHTWLEQEIDLVRPEVIVCLGTTAARAVLGRPTTIRSVRGQVLDGPGGAAVVVTIHPSAVLRAPDEDRDELRAGLAEDLALAWSVTRSR